MKSPSVDVIVVGAGVAGLAAAGDLARGGLKVLILEARNRLGGRIFTRHLAGTERPIELGAEFVHGGNRALTAVMRDAGLRSRGVPEKHWLIDAKGRREMPDIWDRIDRVMEKIGPDTTGSFAAWLHRHGAGLPKQNREAAESFVEGFEAAAKDKMSAHSLFVAGSVGEGEQSRLEGGYDRLIKALHRRVSHSRVKVKLKTVVTRIGWQPRDVTVQAGKHTWRTKSVLITVPLGVLKARAPEKGALRFVPRLREKEALWRRVESGHALRIALRLHPDAWTRDILPADLRRRQGREFGFLHSVERDFPVWWAEAPAPLLVGWAGGPAAVAMSRKSDEEIFSTALKTLSRLLQVPPVLLKSLVRDWHTHNWTTDPFTRGAYSFSMAGTENAPFALGSPVDSTLFFAGEATADPLELGTVHGALASGQRAAREILNALPDE